MKIHRIGWLSFVCAILMILSVTSYAFASFPFLLQSPVDRELESIAEENSEPEVVSNDASEEESVPSDESAEPQISADSDAAESSQSETASDEVSEEESTPSDEVVGPQVSDDSDDSLPSDNEDVGGGPSTSNDDDSGDGGPNYDPDSSNPSASNPSNITPNDDDSSSTPIVNEPPVADAGGPYYGHTGDITTFDGSGSYDPDGYIVGYKWDFDGDGSYDTAWLTNPIIDYVYSDANTYTVELKVKDNGNVEGSNIKYDTDTAIAYITVNQEPVAIIIPNEVTVWVGTRITFYGGNSYDPDGSIYNYKWLIQDENGGWELFQEGQNDTFIKTFDEVDSYYVRLKVIDDDDASGSADSSVLIHNGEDPLAVIDLVDEAEKNVEVEFVGSNSWDPDGYIVSWYWTFGCGSTDSGEIVYHEYANVGSYDVTLTVTDNNSNIHTSTDRINISEDDDDDGTGASAPLLGPQGADGGDLLLNDDITGASSSSPELPGSISSTTSSFLKVKILERISQTLSKISAGSMLLESIIASKVVEILSDDGSSPTGPLSYNFTVGISYAPWPCYENQEITFICNIYGNPTGPLEYFWDFENDGTWDAAAATAAHTYTVAGSYVVILKVRDTYNDEIATASTTVIVEDDDDDSLNMSISASASTVVAMSASTLSGNLGL